MNKKVYFGNTPDRQDGAALVIALGLLALLLLMLIGFLASSLLEQRIAYSYTDNVGSRLLARSALVRAKSQLASLDDLMWFRNRSVDVKLFAPIVSIANDNTTGFSPQTNDNAAGNGSSVADESGDAYQALAPLLRTYLGNNSKETAANIRKNWHWRNFFPQDKKVDYPQWIYYYNNEDKDIITGRLAYIIIPNYGIDPSLLGGETQAAREITGSEYDELLLKSFVTDGRNWGHTYNSGNLMNWLSLDMMVSGKISSMSEMGGNSVIRWDDIKGDFFAGELGGTDTPGSLSGSSNGAYKEFAELYFTTAQKMVDEKDLDGNERTNIKFTAGYNNAPSHATWKGFLDRVEFEPASVRDQVAANIVDYIDTDSIPTSDVADTKTWLTETPNFTGNEKTPYINQIVPAFELTGTYTVEKGTAIDEMQSVTRNLSFAHKGKIYVELINIYPAQLSNVRKIVIKDVSFTLKGEIRWGTAAGESFTPAATGSNNSKAVSQVFSKDQIEIDTGADITVSANGYAVATADVTFTGSIPAASDTRNMSTGVTPAADVDLKIRDFKFERAVLLDKDGNGLDFVKGMTVPDGERNFIGTVENTTDPLMPDNRNAWVFTTSGSTFTSAAYADFQVNDPRCNLTEDNWKIDFVRDKAAVTQHTDLKLGEKNKDAGEVKNEEISDEKDLEYTDDPAKVATGFIRNNAMVSPWELGYIHRGEPWKTINLLAALDPLDGDAYKKATYNNDAVILDKISFGPDSSTKADKFNINYPGSKPSAFMPLTYNLKGHNVVDNASLKADTAASLLKDLDSGAEKELREWIASKCYKPAGSDPAADPEKAYQRYIHRGMLANVITAWAVNGEKSPYKKAPAIYIEELIGKLVPLTRCGENFEHFTVFAVAQSIKDVKGTIYLYKGDGTIDTSKTKTDCKHGGKVECIVTNGEVTDYYDKITSETYLVARLRRQLTHCEKTDKCRQGIHEKACTVKVEVVDCHTINEL